MKIASFIASSFALSILFFAVLTTASAQNNLNPLLPIEPTVEDPDMVIDLLVLTDETAIQVIDLLEQLTDKIILRRQDLPVTKINFNSRGPIKKAEAILALESLLSLNGIMLTDMGGRFLKAVPASNPSSQVPMMIHGSTLYEPASQQIYAKLFKLNYLVADQTTTSLITPFLSPNHNLTIYPKSNALLITDALVNLQRTESILKENDQPQAIRESVEFIKLEFVQAKDMEGQLRSLIDGSLKSYLQGNTNITVDERTNQLILVTHPANLALIQSVIENIDIDAAPLTASEVFPLKQAKAEDVVKIIDEIITGQRKSREDDAKTANTKAPQPNPNAPPNPISAAATSPNASANSNASLQFSEYVGLSADERINAIVAYGTQQDLKTLETLIEKIDIPLPQVRIEAIIAEVRLTENQNTGLKKFVTVFNSDQTLADSSGVIELTNDNLTNQLKTTTDIISGNFAFDAVLEVAEDDSDVKIISTPSIVVSHNEEGVINVSDSIPIITGSSSTLSSTSTLTNVRSSIEYRDIGLTLEVTPLIGADGSVQMEINQSANQLSLEKSRIDNNDLSIIGKREANSTITVADGQVAVLAGLQQNSINDTQSYFPLIGRMPVLKNILSHKSKRYIRTELILFLRPTIIRDPGQSRDLTKDILDNYEEGETIEGYLEDGTIREIYMEGSRLSPKKKDP
ncbi:MAG: Type II secretion system protein D [Puniceicoccaceae bacterium MED-G32]|nr:MAG: Type II secretion system protein D [Puniceicoccaceae bacterium MED-G32]